MHFQHKKAQQKRAFFILLGRTGNVTEFLKWISFFKQYQIHWLNMGKQMLALPFHIEFQRTDDFSLEVRAGESIFPLTLQDFHKSYFKELFISCLAFLQLLSLIWTLFFAHIFFYSCISFYCSLNCFFYQEVECTSICPSHGDHTKVRNLIYLCIIPISHQCNFFLKSLESKTAVIQANTTDLYAVLKISEVFRYLFGGQFIWATRIFFKEKQCLKYTDKWRKKNPLPTFYWQQKLWYSKSTFPGSIFSTCIHCITIFVKTTCLCSNSSCKDQELVSSSSESQV